MDQAKPINTAQEKIWYTCKMEFQIKNKIHSNKLKVKIVFSSVLFGLHEFDTHAQCTDESSRCLVKKNKNMCDTCNLRVTCFNLKQI